MTTDFESLLKRLRRTRSPEEIFGADPSQLKQRYRHWVFQIHPDQNPGAKEDAAEAFRLLQRLYEGAERKVEEGGYGKATAQTATLEMVTPSGRYWSTCAPVEGDLSHGYRAHGPGGPAFVKVARSARASTLLAVEAERLAILGRALDAHPLRPHFPRLQEAVQIVDAAGQPRRVNVLDWADQTVTLAHVIRAYPRGLDARDMAWIFNRLLAALAVTHEQGLVHGAVVPAHLLLRLSDHNGMLIDWSYSVYRGERVQAISPGYRAVCAPEVLARDPARPATDLFMAAQCMVALLGGDPSSPRPAESLPPAVPRAIAALLAAMLIPSPHRRLGNGWQVFDDFRTILEDLYGPPEFRELTLPPQRDGVAEEEVPA